MINLMLGKVKLQNFRHLRNTIYSKHVNCLSCIEVLASFSIFHYLNILFVTNMQGGLVYSNKVVIVSSMYSKERIISSFSHGLEPTLAIHK